MPSVFAQDCLFSIIAKHSNKALDVPGPRKLEIDVPVQQWEWAGPGAETQRFLLLPLDDKGLTFAIASWASGMFLGIEMASREPEAPLLQGPWFDSPHHMFQFEPVPGEPDTYWIRVLHSGLLLDVHHSRTDNGAPIVQYQVFPGNETRGDNQKFIVKPLPRSDRALADSPDLRFDDKVVKALGDLQNTPAEPLAIQLPALTDPQMPSLGRHFVAVGQPVVLPYAMVPDNNLRWQVRRSPYYTLTRQVGYTLQEEYFTYNNTSSEQEYEVVVNTGFSAEQASSFSKTTGLVITNQDTHNVGVKISAEKKLAIAKVAGELHYDYTKTLTDTSSVDLGYSSTTTLARNKQDTVRRLVKCPAHTSLAVWTRTSRFTLTRLDGSVLRTWEVPEGGVFIDECPIPQ